MSIEALDLIRERIARHGIDCDWRDGYLGLATTARKGRGAGRLGRPHRAGLRLPAAAHRPSRGRPLDRQPALPQRRARPALGPPAPAEVHAGPGARGGGGRRAAARGHAGRGARARRRRPRCARRMAGCAHARCCWPATSTCDGLAPALAPRIMPVGTYIACSAAMDPARATALIPSRRGGVRHQLRARLLPHHRRPPHAVRRARQLQHGHAAAAWPTACGARMAQTFPQLADLPVRVRLGRLRRHHA